MCLWECECLCACVYAIYFNEFILMYCSPNFLFCFVALFYLLFGGVGVGREGGGVYPSDTKMFRMCSAHVQFYDAFCQVNFHPHLVPSFRGKLHVSFDILHHGNTMC